ncbi:MAG: DNA-processing protein DprA [Schleiferiaceae bacterium]
MNPIICDIGLTLLKGIGPVKARKIVAKYENAEAFFISALSQKPPQFIVKKPELRSQLRPALQEAEKEWEYCQDHGISVLTPQMEAYPKRLLNCHDHPTVLYFRGNTTLNPPRMIAVVGTRSMTSYGKKMVSQLVSDLKDKGVTVVSGLAYGIDITAHRECIDHEIPTIGVLGHGLDRIYPSVHWSEARSMVNQRGGLLTEFRVGEEPSRENFPKRNRIVAGMCDAVIVVEAARNGGALITASIANSYNRDVFAFPGPVGAVYSEGCNKYLKSHKASLIESVADLEYVMGWEPETQQTISFSKEEVEEENRIREEQLETLSPFAQKLIGKLDQIKERRLELLALDLSTDISKCLSEILMLELDGWIEMAPGQVVKLKR